LARKDRSDLYSFLEWVGTSQSQTSSGRRLKERIVVVDFEAIKGTIATLIYASQKLREVTKKVEDAEINGVLADLSLSLSDLKTQMADLQGENIKLKEDLKKARELKNIRKKLGIRNGLYHLNEEIPGYQNGPYCTRCIDVDGILVLVNQFKGSKRAFGEYGCPNCNFTFNG